MLCTPLAAGASVVDCPRSLANRTCAPDRQLCPARCRDMLLIDGLVLSRLVLRRPYNYHPVLQMPRAFHQAGRNSEHSLHTSAARTYTLRGHTHTCIVLLALPTLLTYSLTHSLSLLSEPAGPTSAAGTSAPSSLLSLSTAPSHSPSLGALSPSLSLMSAPSRASSPTCTAR